MPGLKPGIFCLYILLLYYIWHILTKPHLTNIALLMKKILILIALTTFIISCSSDDSTPVNPEEKIVLLKKRILTDEDGNSTTYNYIYENNKIMSITGSDNSSTVYTYTSNFITVKQVVNSYVYETTSEYNSENKLIVSVSLLWDGQNNIISAKKELYTYNENGTETINSYTGDAESQTEHTETTIVSYPNENTVKYETNDGRQTIDTYDGKNNPMKSISQTSAYTQNLLTRVDILNGDAVTFFDNTYTYNSHNYPITSTGKVYQMGIYKTFTEQFFYE